MSSQRCDRAAGRINTLLGIYQSRFGLRLSPPTLFNMTFTAGTTHLLAAVRHRTNKIRETAITGARECIGYLYSIGESWPAAKHKGDILSKLVEDYHLESTTDSHPETGAGQGVESPRVSTSPVDPTSWIIDSQPGPSNYQQIPAMPVQPQQVPMDGDMNGWDSFFDPAASL